MTDSLTERPRLTADAPPLATALVVRASVGDLALATHDPEMAVAAQAVGFEVLP